MGGLVDTGLLVEQQVVLDQAREAVSGQEGADRSAVLGGHDGESPPRAQAAQRRDDARVGPMEGDPGVFGLAAQALSLGVEGVMEGVTLAAIMLGKHAEDFVTVHDLRVASSEDRLDRRARLGQAEVARPR